MTGKALLELHKVGITVIRNNEYNKDVKIKDVSDTTATGQNASSIIGA